MEKKVSIIVPVYNAASCLGRCMGSLLGQTYGNTEILLIDDGSTDGSGRICDDFAHRFGKVKVFHGANAGVSAARNRGMEECTGEYLAFVDADDILADDMLEHLVCVIEGNRGDVAGCGYFAFHGDDGKELRGDRENTGNGDAQIEVLGGSEFIEKGILQSDTRCWSKLYRRESVGSLRFDTGLTIGEDMLFLLELAVQGKKFCRSGYKGYGYYVNAKGAMLQGFKDSYMDQIACWQQALEVIGRARPDLADRAEAILLISVMLVVGKLALLPGKERRKKVHYAGQCFMLVKKYSGNRRAFRELDRGYRIKVRVYGLAPKLYMALYGMLCCWKTLKTKDFMLFFIDNFI